MFIQSGRLGSRRRNIAVEVASTRSSTAARR
jgi:hypothetical protein